MKTTIEHIENHLLKHYTHPKDKTPWVFVYQSDKESAMLLHLICQMLLRIQKNKQKRLIYMVINDTLIENPFLVAYLKAQLKQIADFIKAEKLPIVLTKIKPEPTESFWFRLIGKGELIDGFNNRWCTIALKINPLKYFLEKQINTHKMVYLLLASHYHNIKKNSQDISDKRVTSIDFKPYEELSACWVSHPLLDLADDDLWLFLLQNKPMWGGSYRTLITLYRNVSGGQCPTISYEADLPICATTSAKFSCWPCFFSGERDGLDGLVQSGFDNHEVLLDFRHWLWQRLTKARTEQLLLLPLTWRQEILKKLNEVMAQTEFVLIDDDQIQAIKSQWQ